MIILASAAAVSAQTIDVNKVPTIEVTGTAEISVAPDNAEISMRVLKLDKNLAAAKKANDDEVAKVIELTKRFGIKPADVKTDYISINEKYERRVVPNTDGEVYTNEFLGYEVSRTITATLRDLGRFESFLTELTNAGVSNINSVDFKTSQLREHKDKARSYAIKAARQKAEAVAAEIGQSIGKAISIEENNIDTGWARNSSPYSNTFVADGKDVGSDAIGSITVKAQFTVKFILN